MRYLSKHFSRGETMAIMGDLHGADKTDLFREWWGKWKDTEESKQALEERKSLRDLYSQLYERKAEQVSGKQGVKVRFDAQANSLLKQDWAHYGKDELENLFYLFFSDKVLEVVSFTRHKNKAGYGYNVFHGMIEKLILSGLSADRPCPHCGKIGGHEWECKILTNRRQRVDKEREEALSAQEAYDGPGIKELFQARKMSN